MAEFNTPVLFIIFNRPDLAEITIASIKEVKPTRLFIAADGPRRDHTEDTEKCRRVRELVLSMIDWDCEVRTLFQEKNLGCKQGPQEAIAWFFQNVNQGIILEDDCLPLPEFFTFCQKCLEKYCNTAEVMHISGNNFTTQLKYDYDVVVSKYSHSWGWATWKRAWEKYDDSFPELESNFENAVFDFLSKKEKVYWKKTFELTKSGLLQAWDYRWMYSIWLNSGISILPKWNLVKNIGFGEDATHTTANDDRFDRIITKGFDAIKFPHDISVNHHSDHMFFDMYLLERIGLMGLIKRLLK